MCPMILCVLGHLGSPSGSVWWIQDRAVTISFISPPGDRLVRHAPQRVSAHNYHFVPAPALQNVALEPSVPGGVRGWPSYWAAPPTTKASEADGWCEGSLR